MSLISTGSILLHFFSPILVFSFLRWGGQSTPLSLFWSVCPPPLSPGSRFPSGPLWSSPIVHSFLFWRSATDILAQGLSDPATCPGSLRGCHLLHHCFCRSVCASAALSFPFPSYGSAGSLAVRSLCAVQAWSTVRTGFLITADARVLFALLPFMTPSFAHFLLRFARAVAVGWLTRRTLFNGLLGLPFLHRSRDVPVNPCDNALYKPLQLRRRNSGDRIIHRFFLRNGIPAVPIPGSGVFSSPRWRRRSFSRRPLGGLLGPLPAAFRHGVICGGQPSHRGSVSTGTLLGPFYVCML